MVYLQHKIINQADGQPRGRGPISLSKSGYEKIVYTNNSPDKLDKLYFHLWQNELKYHEKELDRKN
mgnify:CR=1 FL=1